MCDIIYPEKIIRHRAKQYTKKRQPYKAYNNAYWNWTDIFDEIDNLKKVNNKGYMKNVSQKYGINYVIPFVVNIHNGITKNLIILMMKIEEEIKGYLVMMKKEPFLNTLKYNILIKIYHYVMKTLKLQHLNIIHPYINNIILMRVMDGVQILRKNGD